jgi:glycosyltransferase involved in cell wall biosynthesis
MALEAGKLDASVVIPSRDRPKSLPLVLDDLFSQAGSRRFEVIVVDDGSEPPIECTSEDAVVPITVLRLEGCGPAVARNVGWRAARADVILFTDDDVRLSENWVDVACRAFEADSSVVAVEGPVKTRTFDWLFE